MWWWWYFKEDNKKCNHDDYKQREQKAAQYLDQVEKETKEEVKEWNQEQRDNYKW